MYELLLLVVVRSIKTSLVGVGLMLVRDTWMRYVGPMPCSCQRSKKGNGERNEFRKSEWKTDQSSFIPAHQL
jgi:hypothetical protein